MRIDVATLDENFVNWDVFANTYYPIVREALGSFRFVPADLVDDWANSFFVEKLMDKDFLANRPVLRGPFRNWLFRAVKNHAYSELRKVRSRGQHHAPVAADVIDVPDDRPESTPTFESDAIYALTYLAVALQTARRHWESVGEAHKWRIFDALVLGETEPGVARPTRDELVAEFGGRDRQYLDNCVTSVKRSIRSLLPLLLPAEMSEGETPEARFEEWFEILRDGKLSELGWLKWALPADPGAVPAEEQSQLASVALFGDHPGTIAATPLLPLLDDDGQAQLPPEFEYDRLRVAQSVILATPFSVYLDGPRSEVAAMPRAGRGATGLVQAGQRLQDLLGDLTQPLAPAQRQALVHRMTQLKRYGKRVHQEARQSSPVAGVPPADFGYLIYTAASAIALIGAGERIDTLSDATLASNVSWALRQPWVDARFHPVLQRAIARLTA